MEGNYQNTQQDILNELGEIESNLRSNHPNITQLRVGTVVVVSCDTQCQLFIVLLDDDSYP